MSNHHPHRPQPKLKPRQIKRLRLEQLQRQEKHQQPEPVLLLDPIIYKRMG